MSTPCPLPRNPGPAGTSPGVYQRRRFERTVPYQAVQEHLETWLARQWEANPEGDPIPDLGPALGVHARCLYRPVQRVSGGYLPDPVLLPLGVNSRSPVLARVWGHLGISGGLPWGGAGVVPGWCLGWVRGAERGGDLGGDLGGALGGPLGWALGVALGWALVLPFAVPHATVAIGRYSLKLLMTPPTGVFAVGAVGFQLRAFLP
jgi:hypothetical protein